MIGALEPTKASKLLCNLLSLCGLNLMDSPKNSSNIIDTAVAYAIAYIVQAPKLLFVIVSARGSGELWIYLYLSYYKRSDRHNQYINTHIGKTIVGLGWMSFVFVPAYYVVHGFHEFMGIDALDMAVTVVVYSLFFQLLATLATIKWKAPR
jgi:hypothetical protein